MDYIDTSNLKPKKLPDKKVGRHRFIAIASFTITEEGAQAARQGDSPAILDHENLWDISIGCVDCEQPYAPDLKRYCPGPTFVERER